MTKKMTMIKSVNPSYVSDSEAELDVLLFGIFVEYNIQEIWKRFKKEP